MKSLSDILSKHNPLTGPQYVSREFQDFGLRLARELNDMKNKSLYIKLAKTIPRHILEEAKNSIKDASNVRSKAKLFMWKMKQLRLPAGSDQKRDQAENRSVTYKR